MQIAKANGHFVIGTAGTQAGLDLVLKEGANLAFNHREEGYIEKIKVSLPQMRNILFFLKYKLYGASNVKSPHTKIQC